MNAFHFLRPLWLLMFLPLLALVWSLFRPAHSTTAWSQACDPHLLPFLMQPKHLRQRLSSWVLLLSSAMLMIIALAGPTWSRLPVPSYHEIKPRVVVLDMSTAMLVTDLSPDRLSRAKFKLHDLFHHQGIGQWGLVVYTGEPFVVSPLTDDGQTIDALLSSLTPDVMPVGGSQLSSALEQAGQLITQAGFKQGQILVFAASPPSPEALSSAKILSEGGVHTSIVPVLNHDVFADPMFKKLAEAGEGELIPFTDTSADIEQWLAATSGQEDFTESPDNEIPEWRDEGRWFLIPSLVFLLPVFRRGWVQGISP